MRRTQSNIHNMTDFEVTELSALSLEIAGPKRERAPRYETKVRAYVDAGGTVYIVNVLNISSRGLMIDRPISIRHADRCVVTLQTDPFISLSCTPIIGGAEFSRGHWNRLRIKNEIDLSKTIGMMKKGTAA